MFKTLSLAIVIAAAAAAATPAHAGWPISNNGVSYNALAPNALAPNAVEGHAALNGRVIGIELPPATGNFSFVNPGIEPALTRSVDDHGRIAYQGQWGCNLDSGVYIGC